MNKYSLSVILLVIICLSVFSLALSEDWTVYVNNKPFNGSISASKDVVLVSISELSAMLKFTYKYNDLTNNLKINDIAYAGPRVTKEGKLFVSLSDVAKLIGARYNYDPKAYTATIQTFNLSMVGTTPVPATVTPTPSPQGQKGDEVKVKGIREMRENELIGKMQYGISTIGVTGTVENTVKVAAKNVVLTVLVKDGYGKVQETLTKQVGTLKAGESQSFEVFFRDGSIYYDPQNPAIIYRGVRWVYDGKVDFKLEESPTPTTTPALTPAEQ